MWIQLQAGEVDMSSLIRLYPACYKGDIQAINAGSLDVHINLQYKKWKEAGKMVEDNHAHQTQIYKKKTKFILATGWEKDLFAHRSVLARDSQFNTPILSVPGKAAQILLA